MKIIFSGILLCMLMLSAVSADSQANPPVLDGGIGNWYFLHPSIKIHKKLTVGNEFHLRRDDWSMKPLQILERPYISFHAYKHLDLTVGGSYYRIYSADPIPQGYDYNEFHFWEQLTLKHQTPKNIKFFHRYRVEHRFIDVMTQDSISGNWSKSGSEFKNRFRYRMLMNIPLYKMNESAQLYLNVYDELWMGMTNYLMFSSFLRNRIYAGFGWQYNKQGSVELAYMNQFDSASAGRYISRNIIMLTLNYAFDLSQKQNDIPEK